MSPRKDAPLPAPLVAFHGSLWRRELQRRSLAWALATVALLALWTGLCLILSLPRGHYYVALLFLLSLLPAFLFWPLPRGFFLLPLRAADPDTAIETWLEKRRLSPPGPSSSLLEKAAAGRIAELALKRPSRAAVGRGLLPLALFASLSLGLLELVSVLTLGRPSLVYAGPALVAGSGMKLDGNGAGAPAPAEGNQGEAGSLPDRREAAIEAAGRTEALAPQAGPAEAEALRQALKEAALGGGEAATGPTPPAGSPGDAARSGEGARAGRAISSRPTPADSSRGAGVSDAAGRGATGYEGSGRSGVPSPLLDYKTRNYELSTSPSGQRSRASGELASGDRSAIEARGFGGFVLSAGLRPREDAYLALLRRRWSELSAPSQAAQAGPTFLPASGGSP